MTAQSSVYKIALCRLALKQEGGGDLSIIRVMFGITCLSVQPWVGFPF